MDRHYKKGGKGGGAVVILISTDILRSTITWITVDMSSVFSIYMKAG